MKRQTIIATCLVNSSMYKTLAEAEQRVRQVFDDEHPKGDFQSWNKSVKQKVSEQIIKNVGRASRINVKRFIEDLGR